MSIVKISQIRDALMSLHDALDRRGESGRKHSLFMKVTLPPAPDLSPEQIVESVEKNKKISEKLTYTLQAAVGKEPFRDLDLEQAKTAIRKFEQDLASLPGDLQAKMSLEFVCPNDYEVNILKEVQEIANTKMQLSQGIKDVAAQAEDSQNKLSS